MRHVLCPASRFDVCGGGGGTGRCRRSRRRRTRAGGSTGGDGLDTIGIPEDKVSAVGVEFRVQCQELGLSQIEIGFH